MNIQLILILLAAIFCGNGIVIVANAGEAKNLATVKKIFDAFDKGDIKPFIDSFASKYEFKTMSAAEFDPVVGDFSNNAEEFFTKSPYTITSSKVVSTVSNSNQVVVFLESVVVVDGTGKTGTTTGVNQFTFDNKGKIISFILTEDTALIQDLLTHGDTSYSLMALMTKTINDHNTRNIETTLSSYATDARFSLNSNSDISLEEYKKSYLPLFDSIPDLHYAIINMTPYGNRIAVRSLFTGTFSGKPYMGIPSNGNKINVVMSIFSTIKNGKIVYTHIDFDDLSFLTQMGILKLS